MEEQTRFPATSPVVEKPLQPVRWDWPQNFPLEPANLFAEDKKLWVLCPRKVWNWFGPKGEEPIQFSDDRQATLFCFEPEFRQPLPLAIHFENNGQTLEPFQPPPNDPMRNWRRLMDHTGNTEFWMKTPEGLVFSTTSSCGHWLISSSVLEPKLQAQRDLLHQSSTSPAPSPANLQKP
jgi:hypothetical protein